MASEDMTNRPIAHHAPDASVSLLDCSVGDALREAAVRRPDRRALGWSAANGLEYLTYAQLLEEAEQIAGWLLAQCQPRDRIAIWSITSPEWLLLEYACALAGLTIVSWNPAWKTYECEHARELTEPALLFAGTDNRGTKLFDRASGYLHREKVRDLTDLRNLAKEAPRPAQYPTVSPDDPFLIQFTSGTTGRAKGAILSNRAALNSAWLRLKASGVDHTDVWLSPSPSYHVGGAVLVTLGAMSVGACLVIVGKFDAREYAELMRLSGATLIGGVPTVLLAVVEQMKLSNKRQYIKSIGVGGTNVPEELMERLMREFDAPALSVYGQSEAPLISYPLPDDSASDLVRTVGRAAPHVEMKICDPQSGATLACGDVGEVLVRSPFMMDGYYRSPEATEATFTADGFIRTGDLGSLDERGYLTLKGRSRDVIIRGGVNIYPAEIEAVLAEHPGVRAVAVVGVADERLGQSIAAAVVMNPGSAFDAAQLEQFVADRISYFKVPRMWKFVEDLPLTASGKIRKIEVEAMFDTGPAI